MDGSRVSVVIPYYHGAGTICDTLDGLAKQTAGGFEIIVVDDASPDPLPARAIDLLAALGGRVERMQSNGGPARAKNRGVELVTRPIVTFLDQDDWLEPTAVAVLAERTTQGTVIAFDNRLVRRDADGVFVDLGETVFGRAHWYRRKLLPDDQAEFMRPGFPMLKIGVDVDDFRRCGGFPSRVLAVEDYLLVWRLLANGNAFEFVGPHGVHALSDASMTARVAHGGPDRVRSQLSWMRVATEIATTRTAQLTTRRSALRGIGRAAEGAAKALGRWLLTSRPGRVSAGDAIPVTGSAADCAASA